MATSAASAASAPRDATLAKLARAAAVGAPLVAALLVWALTLPDIDLYSLGDYGLTLELPVGWYAALAVCVLGTVLHASLGSTRWAWVYLLGAVVVLFATLPLLAEQPHYSFSYKHIGVVRLLEANHEVHTNIDIYNRWPGFFALSAVFGTAGGLSNPVKYAAWSEFFFTVVNLLFLGSIVRVLTGSLRAPVAAGLLFVAFNWVGQAYFSPQALTFSLHLVILWLVVTQLSREGPGPGGRAVLGVAARIVRRPQDAALSTGHRMMPTWFAVVAILVIDAGLVASHQLTPYVLVLQVGALTMLGLVRPRLLAVGLLVLAVAYLVPNFDFVKDNFGFFNGVDPFSNIERPSRYDVGPVDGKVWNERAGQALVLLMLGGAAISTIVLARRGRGTRALVLLVFALAPFALVLGQNYGGEAVLRVVLFSSPWCAALIAWALMDVPKNTWRVALLGASAVVTSALFIPANFGQEELHSIRLDEVRASEQLYTQAQAPAVIMVTTPLGFPPRYGPRYPEFRYTNLMKGDKFRGRALGAADVPAVVHAMRRFRPRGYIVFSTTQNTYANVFRITKPGALGNLETAIGRSPQFRLFYRGSDTRIYELLPPPAVTATAALSAKLAAVRRAAAARAAAARAAAAKRARIRARAAARRRARRAASANRRPVAPPPAFQPQPVSPVRPPPPPPPPAPRPRPVPFDSSG